MLSEVPVTSTAIVRHGSATATPTRRKLSDIAAKHTDLLNLTLPSSLVASTGTATNSGGMEGRGGLISKAESAPQRQHQNKEPPQQRQQRQPAVSDFSSFVIAETTSELIGGQVDVVSDAANIKQLMRVPYAAQEQISMAVHRVGKTLLLDRYDMTSTSSSSTSSSSSSTPSSSAATQPASSLQDQVYQKLLQYTISTEEEEEEEEEKEGGGGLQLDVRRRPAADMSTFPSSPPLTSHLMSDYFALARADPLSSIATTTTTRIVPDDVTKSVQSDPVFQRIVHWTFQDLSMLVGSNMLIFGDDQHPAISLKLRDASQPINVLTGIDDWLDNLMCNVPEVAMCYHLNGVVQSFDLIKTEEIPNMRDSSFSPATILDTAQNILSFLKRNCTREGGTYWLYKSADDDVVKLYDLSNLTSAGDARAVASMNVHARSPTLVRTQTKGSAGTTSASSSAPSSSSSKGSSKPPPARFDATSNNSTRGNPFELPVAMLLYRMAKNLSKSKSADRDTKSLVLILTNCLQLLHDVRHSYPVVYSSALRLLAEVYLQDGIVIPTSDSPSPSSGSSTNSPLPAPPLSASSLSEHAPQEVPSPSVLADDDGPNYFLPRLGLVGRASPPKAPQPESKVVPSGDGTIGTATSDTSGGTGKKKKAVATNTFKPGRVELSRALDLLFEGLGAFDLARLGITSVQEQSKHVLDSIGDICDHLGELELNGVAPIELTMTSALVCICWYSLAILSTPRPEPARLITSADVFFRASVLVRQNGKEDLRNYARQFSTFQYERLLKLAKINALDQLFKVLETATESFEAIDLLHASTFIYTAAVGTGRDQSAVAANRRLGNAYNEIGLLHMQQQKFDDAHEYFDKALQVFRHLHDSLNMALVLCNAARIGLMKPSTSLDDDVKGMQDSINCYKQARESLKHRPAHPQVYDAILHELGQAHFALASFKHRQLQDMDDGSIRVTFIIDNFLAAIKCFDEQLSYELADPISQKVRTSLGLAHFRLGHMHHLTTTTQLPDAQHKSKIKTLALNHYVKAFAYLDPGRDCLAFVQSRLEWAELSFPLSSSSSSSSNGAGPSKSFLFTLISRLLETRSALVRQDEFPAEIGGPLWKLCLELVGRLQQILQILVRQVGTSHVSAKELYMAAVRLGAPILSARNGDGDVIRLTHALLDVLSSKFIVE